MQNRWDSKTSRPPLDGLSPPGATHSPVGRLRTGWSSGPLFLLPQLLLGIPQTTTLTSSYHWTLKELFSKEKERKTEDGMGANHCWAGRKNKPESPHRSVTLVLGYLSVCCSLQLALNVIGFGGLFCIIIIGKHWWDMMKKGTYPYTLEDSFVTIGS